MRLWVFSKSYDLAGLLRHHSLQCEDEGWGVAPVTTAICHLVVQVQVPHLNAIVSWQRVGGGKS